MSPNTIRLPIEECLLCFRVGGPAGPTGVGGRSILRAEARTVVVL